MNPGQKQRKDGGLTISGQSKLQTGHLDRRTILHKRYQIQGVIGQGGMGAVYLAKDLRDKERLYAIKEMSLSLISSAEQPQAIQNFKVEAKILWGLDHPNLPKLKGFFSEDERYFLVMEYINGDTLENYLERKKAPFPERRVLDWARQLCDVLEYLHKQVPPIIFRDMKPGNIMLSRSGQLKLIDFGIARFFRPASDQDTQILGTPGYAPPEQYGKAQTDERSDIYALGMTLFHLLTNKLSEHGFGLENVHRDYPHISPNVARALEKATEIKPDNRFQTADEFRHALFDVGVFVFESGDIVATPQEMAIMCSDYPEEAADYLYDGEIEAWLLDMGEVELAEITNRLAHTNADPMVAVEQFIQAVVKQTNSSTRGNTSSAAATNATSAVQTRNARLYTPPTMSTVNTVSANRQRHTPLQGVQLLVSPRILDFGTVFPGISAPLTMKISGPQGLRVQGTVHTDDPWIQLSQVTFDASTTEINVRVNSLQLQRNTHYSGQIVISPDGAMRSDIIVKVEAEVQSFVYKNRRHPGRTHGADLDDYDEDENDATVAIDDLDNLLGSGGVTGSIATPAGKMVQTIVTPTSPAVRRKGKELDKFGVHYAQDSWPLSTNLERWQQVGLTFACALMASSLSYTWYAGIKPSPLAPQPWFILVMATMLPTSTFGALIVQVGRTWKPNKAINLFLTGIASALLGLSVVEFAWQLVSQGHGIGWVQLLVMLLVSSTGASIGVHSQPHHKVMDTIVRIRAAVRRRRVFLTLGGLVGAIAGIGLTCGFGFGPFTLFGILLSMAIGAGLVWRVDSLVKLNRRQKV